MLTWFQIGEISLPQPQFYYCIMVLGQADYDIWINISLPDISTLHMRYSRVAVFWWGEEVYVCVSSHTHAYTQTHMYTRTHACYQIQRISHEVFSYHLGKEEIKQLFLQFGRCKWKMAYFLIVLFVFLQFIISLLSFSFCFYHPSYSICLKIFSFLPSFLVLRFLLLLL